MMLSSTASPKWRATADGRTAVTDLEAGDEMLVYYEAVARHFGEAVEESIIEK